MALASIEDSFTLPCGLEVGNRMIKAAMTEGVANEYNEASNELINLYSYWAAESKCGLLITGNIQIDRRFMEKPGNVAIDKEMDPELLDRGLEQLRHWVEMTKLSGLNGQVSNRRYGVKILAQISHAGRQSSTAICTLAPAPSLIMCKSSFPVPHVFEMSKDDIDDVKRRFVFAARQCEEAGFDGIELHAAHGYLLSSFLSPLSNERRDNYGGTLENRARLLLEIVAAIKKAVSSQFCVAVKLNASDFQRGGFDIEESVQVAHWLNDASVDMLEISGGNYETMTMVLGPKDQPNIDSRQGYFVQMAGQISASFEERRMAIMVTGGIRSRDTMDQQIQQNVCDFIGVARPICWDATSVASLLKGRIPSLPEAELCIKMPWWLSMLQVFNPQSYKFMRATGTAMVLYAKMLDISQGYGRIAHGHSTSPGVLSALYRVFKYEALKGQMLRGLPVGDMHLSRGLDTGATGSTEKHSILSKIKLEHGIIGLLILILVLKKFQQLLSPKLLKV